MKRYTYSDVAYHNQPDDCWIVVNGFVVDVTKFINKHPGGSPFILKYAGRDASEGFKLFHNTWTLLRHCRKGIIGRVAC